MRAFLCSAGSEPALAEELARAGAVATELGPGVVASEGELFGDDDEPPTAAIRGQFLRGESAREFITFMFSPAYETASATQ